jgi:hypothetical protein
MPQTRGAPPAWPRNAPCLKAIAGPGISFEGRDLIISGVLPAPFGSGTRRKVSQISRVLFWRRYPVKNEIQVYPDKPHVALQCIGFQLENVAPGEPALSITPRRNGNSRKFGAQGFANRGLLLVAHPRLLDPASPQVYQFLA